MTTATLEANPGLGLAVATAGAVYGLYTAFLPVLVAALFGSSRQLATGPVAVVSLHTASARF